jgi:hypothetical protein
VAPEFQGDRIVAIRDFLFAPNAMEGIELQTIERGSNRPA